MGASLHLKKFTTPVDVPTKLGYGTLFVDTDNKLKLKDGDGTVTEYWQSAYDIALQNGFVGTSVDWLASLVGPAGVAGNDGISAYQLAVNGGFVGTESQWLASLIGPQGNTGSNGLSAYQVAVNGGFVGTESQWLASLIGPQGNAGSNGLSAYQLAVNGGFVGTESQWLASLIGPQGNAGSNGLSAYQLAVNGGFVGTESQWLASLIGPQGNAGSNGLSAYQLAVNGGFVGTESQWLTSLIGPQGNVGQTGQGLTTGGVAGDVAIKASSTDYDLVYKNFDNETLRAVGSVTGDLSGFEDRTTSTITFNEATRTLTIAPTATSYNVWLHGVKYIISVPISIVTHSTSEGFYYNLDPITNTLYNGTVHGGIRENLLCVYIHWDSVNNKAIIFGDERHSYKRDTEWHYNQHRNFGTFWRSGGALGFSLNNESNTNISVGTPLLIADEDLEHNIVHSATPANNYEQILDTAASLPVIYYLNNGYVQTAASTNPFLHSTLAQYNDITLNVGSLVECANNSYVSYWLVATNDIKYPVKLIMGRIQHASLDSALTETFDSYGLPLPEVVSLYQIVLFTSNTYTNSIKSVIVNVRKVTDRESSSGAASSASSHDSLTGRSNADSHPISSITGLQEALNSIHSIPSGGTTNQVLKKINNTDYSVSWQDESGAILIHESDTPPVDTAKYPLWLDTTTARLKIFYTSSNVYIDVLPSIKGDTGPAGVAGNEGLSAYQVAVNGGFVGTESQWLASLVGPQGNAGSNGLSAYQLAVNGGFVGTESQWLASLIGTDGVDGNDGLSAYQVAVNGGFVGTESQWLASLVGPQGNAGSNGLSAYQVAVNGGFVGTESQWLASLVGIDGVDGNDGLSAYQVAVNGGFVGTEPQWLASLVGPQGPAGADGVVPQNLDIQSILLANNTGTLTPTADKAFITAIDIANSVTPAIIESNGVLELIQGALLVKNFNYITAIGNGTTFSALGLAAPSATGTATAATLATTSNYTKTPRVEALVTTAATTAVAGYRNTVANFVLSADTTQRGFKFSMDGGPATGLGTASRRFFMGLMSSTAAPTDVDPSTITNILGIGYSNADTNLQFMYRAAGAVVKLDTGIAKPTADRNALYRLIIVSNDGITSISVIDLISGTHFQATLSNASLPLNTLLTYKIYSSAGGTSSVTGVVFARLYYEYINVNIA